MFQTEIKIEKGFYIQALFLTNCYQAKLDIIIIWVCCSGRRVLTVASSAIVVAS